MKRGWKFLTAGFLFCLGLIALPGANHDDSCVYAQTVYVRDDASLLSETEVADLTDEAEYFASQAQWNIGIATTADAGDKDSEAYADDLYDEWYGIDTDGLLLLIDMDHRNYYLSTSGEAIYYITDARLEHILDDGYDPISQAQYYETFSVMLSDIEAYYQDGVPEGAYSYNRDTGEKEYYYGRFHLTQMEILIAIAVGAAAAAVTMIVIRGKYQLKWGKYSYNFHRFGSTHFTERTDKFRTQMVTHHHISRDNGGGSNGGGSRSTTHTSSSGGSHGGGGRSF